MIGNFIGDNIHNDRIQIFIYLLPHPLHVIFYTMLLLIRLLSFLLIIKNVVDTYYNIRIVLTVNILMKLIVMSMKQLWKPFLQKC